jgi:tetratricopeptide (TPR) repeat protein
MRVMRVFLCSALLGAGCDLKQFTVDTTAPVIQQASRSFEMESDLRVAREAAPAQLKTADGFLVSSPKNRILLEVVAQGYVEYAFGFLEDDLDQLGDDDHRAAERAETARRATRLYERGLEFALRLLALDDPHFADAFRGDVAGAVEASRKLGKKSVAGLFFTGLALASAINLNKEDLSRIVELPKAIALVKRARELDPSFYNGGASMVLGTIYAAQGKAIGGDPDAAKRYFDEAIAASEGRFLLARVMMARFYAVTVQDRALFEKTLKDVLAAPDDILPEWRLANAFAKRRAARYLDRINELF